MFGRRGDMDKSSGGTVSRGVGRLTLTALLLWLLILDIVLIGYAANAFNTMIDNPKTPPATPVTPTVILFALIDGGFLGAGVLLGLSHVYLYSAGSVGPAFTASVFAWGINLLTLGFASKEITFGKIRGSQEKRIEYIVITIAFFATIYLLMLFGALHHSKLGVGYHSSPV